MSFTFKLLAAVVAVWLVLAPPFFTDGACSAEFERESARIDRDQQRLRSSVGADAYFSERSIPHAVMSPEECRRAKPRSLARCPAGALVIGKVPVQNLICRIYRDDEIAIRLQYNERDRLARLEVDMRPYKSLPIPFTGKAIHWAR